MENSRQLHMIGWNLGRTSYGMLLARYLWKLKSEKRKKIKMEGQRSFFWGGGGEGEFKFCGGQVVGLDPICCNVVK
jgi:hypothetical protein